MLDRLGVVSGGSVSRTDSPSRPAWRLDGLAAAHIRARKHQWGPFRAQDRQQVLSLPASVKRPQRVVAVPATYPAGLPVTNQDELQAAITTDARRRLGSVTTTV